MPDPSADLQLPLCEVDLRNAVVPDVEEFVVRGDPRIQALPVQLIEVLERRRWLGGLIEERDGALT